jgi:hypothetical protein
VDKKNSAVRNEEVLSRNCLSGDFQISGSRDLSRTQTFARVLGKPAGNQWKRMGTRQSRDQYFISPLCVAIAFFSPVPDDC